MKVLATPAVVAGKPLTTNEPTSAGVAVIVSEPVMAGLATSVAVSVCVPAVMNLTRTRRLAVHERDVGRQDGGGVAAAEVDGARRCRRQLVAERVLGVDRDLAELADRARPAGDEHRADFAGLDEHGVGGAGDRRSRRCQSR